MDIPVDKSQKGVAIARLTLIAAACLAAMNASGQTAEGSGDRTTNIGFTLGTGYSDNVFQAGGGANSATYRAVGLVADIDRESRRFRAVVEGDIEYRDYSNSSIDDEPWGRIDAELELRAVPDRFSWMALNNYGEGTTDPFLAIGPLNREQINIFETGPAVFLPLGEQTEFRIQGLAGNRSFDDSVELNADTTTTTAGVYREINSTTEVGVTVSTRDVEYDLATADNQIDAAYFSYQKRFSSGAASLNLGTNEVEFGATRRTDDAPYIQIDWAREVGRRSTLALAFSNRLIDAGDSFRDRGADSRDAVLALDVYEEQLISAIVSIDGARADLAFGVQINKDRYQSSNELDNDSIGLVFDYERNITSLMTFTAELDWNDRDFNDTSTLFTDFSDIRAAFGIERFFSRKLTLSAQLQHATRADSALLNFDENQIMIQIRYDLNPNLPADPFEL